VIGFGGRSSATAARKHRHGQGIAGDEPTVPDRNRSSAPLAEEMLVADNSELGPGLTTNGPPSDLSIGQAYGADPRNPLDGEIFDSGLPAAAPRGSYHHLDSFRARSESQLATGTVPTLNYLCLTSDHTRCTQPGFPTPSALVADSDLAARRLVDMISHSKIRSSPVIALEVRPRGEQHAATPGFRADMYDWGEVAPAPRRAASRCGAAPCRGALKLP